MNTLKIEIEWEGPFSLQKVIDKKNDAGKPKEWDGDDYGLYQIYGDHILNGKNTLLYIGIAKRQTFSVRFNQHKKWLEGEENIKIYLGKIYNKKRHTQKNNWKEWEEDIELAEKILIYKYSPNYNSRSLSDEPDLESWDKVTLIHNGQKNKLEESDVAPKDYKS